MSSTPTRLPAPMGLLIDREQVVSFRFEGTTYQGLQGDSIASALAANQRWLLSRSFKYHRPRGVLTMAGQDANTLVQLGGEPNVLADKQAVQAGMEVAGQNYRGSLDHDRDAILGRFGRFMPVGFYYRSFFKPFGAWHRWEKLIRKKAGLGVIDLDFKPEYYDKAYLFYAVVVIGAGAAGMTAALTAAEGGADVLLVDEQPLLGGALSYSRFDVENQRGATVRAELIRRIEQHTRIRVLTEATCNGWFTDNYLPVIQGKRVYKVRAKECIVAAGCFEQHVVFRNNDLPGVMLCSAASRLLRHYAVKPGNAAVVLAGNDDAYLTALDLHDQGVIVKAVVDMRVRADSMALTQALNERGIKVLLKHTVYEALATAGNRHVRGVEVRPVTGKGTVADGQSDRQVIDCDLLCMSAGYMPAYQLLCQAGGQLSYADERAQFRLSNLPEHLQVAGSVNGKHTLAAVLADGERAAQLALQGLGLVDKVELPEVVCKAQVNFPWPIFPHPHGKDFVDYDEDLQSRDIVNATQMGYRDVQLVKRFSTVGMGPSQGRHSALPTARLVAAATGRTVTETGVTTARPPYAPEKLAHMAGRMFDPYRRTRMHAQHLEAGAKMMPAGVWQRPAFYGRPEQRDECMQAEARHVRTKVGLIDVSTLGGLEIRGPDAAELISRMYTFAFLQQPVGRTRYAVMTNEQGVLIDDGVACRIAEDHFYVTATTSGVDRVYREMMRWNAQWRLTVDVAQVTAAFAAVNLAGPDARKVLAKLCDDVDLSPQAFPYLAYRAGHVSGIPARLLRVGFVGELGYEIHVPARYGELLWDIIMEAGHEFEIRPFGVETQRLLRLEKGHIIISQDTDGMTHPGEVGLEWAVNRSKPFFVGRRSVDILAAQPLLRKLVGFRLPKDSPKPLEGHLVLKDGDIRGTVTSCEYSGTLDAIIGMAYVAPEDSALGQTFIIRTAGAVEVAAEVVALPFYDPANQRQEL